MKYICIFIVLALNVSCRTSRDVNREIISDSDSVAMTASCMTFASLDSIIAQACFEFDTLEISSIRNKLADSVKILRLRAVRGRIASNQSSYRQAVEAKTRLDSTAYKISTSEISSEHAASTSVYDPPNTAAIICLSAAIALLFFILNIFFRRK